MWEFKGNQGRMWGNVAGKSCLKTLDMLCLQELRAEAANQQKKLAELQTEPMLDETSENRDSVGGLQMPSWLKASQDSKADPADMRGPKRKAPQTPAGQSADKKPKAPPVRRPGAAAQHAF